MKNCVKKKKNLIKKIRSKKNGSREGIQIKKKKEKKKKKNEKNEKNEKKEYT